MPRCSLSYAKLHNFFHISIKIIRKLFNILTIWQLQTPFRTILGAKIRNAAKVMQTESRTCQARLGNYAEVQLTLSKITSNPPNKPPPFPHFLQKYLHNPNKCLTFAPSVLAKPLNNAKPTTNREQCQTCLNIAEVRRR